MVSIHFLSCTHKLFASVSLPSSCLIMKKVRSCDSFLWFRVVKCHKIESLFNIWEIAKALIYRVWLYNQLCSWVRYLVYVCKRQGWEINTKIRAFCLTEGQTHTHTLTRQPSIPITTIDIDLAPVNALLTQINKLCFRLLHFRITTQSPEQKTPTNMLT